MILHIDTVRKTIRYSVVSAMPEPDRTIHYVHSSLLAIAITRLCRLIEDIPKEGM